MHLCHHLYHATLQSQYFVYNVHIILIPDIFKNITGIYPGCHHVSSYGCHGWVWQDGQQRHVLYQVQSKEPTLNVCSI